MVGAQCGGASWKKGRFRVAEVDGGTEDNTSHSGVVRTVALEGELLLTGGEDAAVKVWAWTHDGSLKYRRTLTGHTDRVEGVTFDTHTGAFPLRWWGGSLLYELGVGQGGASMAS
jgi:WD40 repeat protein